MNIRNKIILLLTVSVLLISITINTSIYFFFYTITTNDKLNYVRLQAENIVGQLKAVTNDAKIFYILNSQLPLNGMIRVVNDDSHPVMTITKETEFTEFKPIFKHSQTVELISVNKVKYAVASFPIIWHDGNIMMLEVTASLASSYDSLKILKLVLIAASLIVLIPSFLAGRMISNIILKPIKSMIETMEEIQRKSIFKKLELKTQSKDELYKLGSTFNKMMDILAKNFEKQQQFVSDASHELKTPLTVIESNASMLKRWGMKDQALLEESIDAIYSEAVRMQEMTKQMLMLANHDAEWNLDIKKVDFISLSKETSKLIKNAYGQEISVNTIHDKVIASADKQKMKQLLFILLDNAIKYSTSPIELNVGYEKGNVFFTVKDYGIGIPQEDIAHIFDRFYRVDKARNRETGGTGLGLSIAKQIVDSHGGNINVVSKEGEGTSFTVTLKIDAFSGENLHVTQLKEYLTENSEKISGEKIVSLSNIRAGSKL
ncbi:HAMP domain-containing sensor histidine kinase [Paenibacillus sp.]|uniref:sensor histidine kinase n=1 Tax=Paenibacillus sp. TaxID=58172 RepID=UPI002D53D673|nr:HAMP domain-containing sensor histidine kinase [Paenibacillus sp.]HZG85529.1 HAMP domain-containing sensor histidine kinase [Paenibacillus sp.]